MSLYSKKISGNTYWYLREIARIDGRPTMVSERYLGTAAEIVAAVDARAAAAMPSRTRHLAFGDVAAVWGMIQRLDVIAMIDALTGPDPAGAGVSRGTYLALAALNRLVALCSKAGFADWWKTTAADRFTKIPVRALDRRRFWDAMASIRLEELCLVEQHIATAIVERFGVDTRSLALEMTNFATYIDTGNDKASIAQRGRAKQKRHDLRLVGLGLVVTRDGGIPLLSHPYPGNHPDVTEFTTMIDALVDRYHQALDMRGDGTGGEMTVVFDAGQNSEANFSHLAQTGVHFVGSIPPTHCPELLKLAAKQRRAVDVDRFKGLTALETRRVVYDTERRVILTHSPALHTAQARGFDQTLAKAGAELQELADTLARGKTRRERAAVENVITGICHDPWVRRVIRWELAGQRPAEHRLTWRVDQAARRVLEEEIFGKRVLVTTRDHWSVAEVVAAYRSQSDAEFAFRQLKDPHVVSLSPMQHFTDHNIRVHVFTCVLALQIAHLMRREAERAGLHRFVRALLDDLAGIGETVLIFPSPAGGGRPKVRRMLTETSAHQRELFRIFGLAQWAPTS